MQVLTSTLVTASLMHGYIVKCTACGIDKELFEEFATLKYTLEFSSTHY